MKQYLGVKRIKASKEMSRKEYCDYRGWDLPENENGEDRVYLVEYEPDINSERNHPDHEGYISMSPKKVFEKAYKKVRTLLVIPCDLKPHQERVVNEAGELDNKINALDSFINKNEIFKTLPVAEQTRLKQQLMAMQYYLTVLVERIDQF